MVAKSRFLNLSRSAAKSGPISSKWMHGSVSGRIGAAAQLRGRVVQPVLAERRDRELRAQAVVGEPGEGAVGHGASR